MANIDKTLKESLDFVNKNYPDLSGNYSPGAGAISPSTPVTKGGFGVESEPGVLSGAGGIVKGGSKILSGATFAPMESAKNIFTSGVAGIANAETPPSTFNQVDMMSQGVGDIQKGIRDIAGWKEKGAPASAIKTSPQSPKVNPVATVTAESAVPAPENAPKLGEPEVNKGWGVMDNTMIKMTKETGKTPMIEGYGLKGGAPEDEADRFMNWLKDPNRPKVPKTVLAGMVDVMKSKLGAGEANDLRRQHLDQLKVANEAALGEKKETDFQKKLIAISPKIQGETGMDEPHWQQGLLDLMDQGHHYTNMYGYEDTAKSLWDKRERQIVSEFENKKLAYNKDDINKPGTLTYKARQELVNKMRKLAISPEKK